VPRSTSTARTWRRRLSRMRTRASRAHPVRGGSRSSASRSASVVRARCASSDPTRARVATTSASYSAIDRRRCDSKPIILQWRVDRRNIRHPLREAEVERRWLDGSRATRSTRGAASSSRAARPRRASAVPSYASARSAAQIAIERTPLRGTDARRRSDFRVRIRAESNRPESESEPESSRSRVESGVESSRVESERARASIRRSSGETRARGAPAPDARDLLRALDRLLLLDRRPHHAVERGCRAPSRRGSRRSPPSRSSARAREDTGAPRRILGDVRQRLLLERSQTVDQRARAPSRGRAGLFISGATWCTRSAAVPATRCGALKNRSS
jgi:hypothetical protein